MDRDDRQGLAAEHQTLQEVVYQSLRQSVLRGKFAPGSPLRQEAIAEQMGVSAMPVREALRRLEAEGLVNFIPRKGAIVKPLDPNEAEDLFLVRALLEPTAARLATPRLQHTELERLNDLITRLDTAAREHHEHEFLELDREFHQVIYNASGRPILLSIIGQLLDRSELYRATAIYRSNSRQDLKQAQIEHKRILSACIAGDAGAAEEATRVNLERSGANLVNTLKRRSES